MSGIPVECLSGVDEAHGEYRVEAGNDISCETDLYPFIGSGANRGMESDGSDRARSLNLRSKHGIPDGRRSWPLS